MTAITFDAATLRAPDMANATPVSFDGARELTSEELALIAGGSIWSSLGRGVEHLAEAVGKGAVIGRITGAVTRSLAPGADAAAVELAGATGELTGALGGALTFLL